KTLLLTGCQKRTIWVPPGLRDLTDRAIFFPRDPGLWGYSSTVSAKQSNRGSRWWRSQNICANVSVRRRSSIMYRARASEADVTSVLCVTPPEPVRAREYSYCYNRSIPLVSCCTALLISAARAKDSILRSLGGRYESRTGAEAGLGAGGAALYGCDLSNHVDFVAAGPD